MKFGRKHEPDTLFGLNVYAFVYNSGAQRYTLRPVVVAIPAVTPSG